MKLWFDLTGSSLKDDGVTPLPRASWGPYQVLDRIGAGGMAEVFLAQLRGVGGFQKRVVVKRLRPEAAADPSVVAAFLDEASLLARAHHRNVAQVYDVGRSEDEYFFSMEYLPGVDLAAVLAAMRELGEPIPPPQACAIAMEVASGLHHVHELSTEDGPLRAIHRDVSPANIMVGTDGSVKLVDFGIAKSVLSSVHTHIGVVKGTTAYMSPEQCVGGSLDRRSDVFSLGVVLYELATMTHPFAAESDDDDDAHSVMQRIVEGELRPLSVVAPDLPLGLARIITTALAPSADARYATADAMRGALEDLARDLGWVLAPSKIAALVSAVADDDATEISPTADPDASERDTLIDFRDGPREQPSALANDLTTALNRAVQAKAETTGVYGRTELDLLAAERPTLTTRWPLHDAPTQIILADEPTRLAAPPPEGVQSSKSTVARPFATLAVVVAFALAAIAAGYWLP
jgi:serine/threonine protein kinase